VNTGKRTIGISIDIGSVASRLRTYGFAERGNGALAYDRALPRFLDLFERMGVSATFFLIGEEAEGHPSRVREIVERGHEVASHTMTHPVSLSALSQRGVARELDESRARLEDLSGTAVRGFRAPNCDSPEYLLERLAATGYQYDSSSCPSPFTWRKVRTLRRRYPGPDSHPQRWRDLVGASAPTWHRTQFGLIATLPMMTVPWLRLPWHHALSFVLPRPVFHLLTEAALLRSRGVHYDFHAMDLLGIEEDGVDARLGIHPGMDDSLEQKQRRAREVLERLRGEAECVSLGRQVARELGADPRSTFSAGRVRSSERDEDRVAHPGLIPFARTRPKRRRSLVAEDYTNDARA